MEREREKGRFKEAGWVRVEEVQKYEWSLCAVPTELQKMTLDLPERSVHSIERYSNFSLY